MKCRRTNKIDDKVKEYIQEKKFIDLLNKYPIEKTPCDLKILSTRIIYKSIHKNEIKNDSVKHLGRKGNFKRPSEKRDKFNDRGETINKRPKEIYIRKELSHQKIDAVKSGKTNTAL